MTLPSNIDWSRECRTREKCRAAFVAGLSAGVYAQTVARLFLSHASVVHDGLKTHESHERSALIWGEGRNGFGERFQ